MPSKSPCWIGSSRSSAARRPSSSPARIISRTSSSRSASTNMCSVRQRPMPSAPNSRALAASAGVSAFVRTFSRRIASAHSRIETKSSFSCGATSGTEPTITSPVPPSIVIMSPSAELVPGQACRSSRARRRAAPRSPSRRACPCRARRRRRATSGRRARSGCRRACTMPWKSSGVVSQRTRMTLSPALPRSSAVSASKTIVPEAAPGRGVEALRDDLDLGGRVDPRVQELVELRRVDARDRLLLRDQPFVHHVDRGLERRGGRPLRRPRLQEVERARPRP